MEGCARGWDLKLEESPFQIWFGQPSYKAFASFRRDVFTHLEHPNLSPGLEDFCGWLWDLHPSFRRGMRSKEIREELVALRQCQGGRSENEATLKFDSETLGGRVTYSALIGPVRKLKVGLEGVTIHYGPSLLTPDGPAGRTVAKQIPLDTVSFFFFFLPWALSALYDSTRPRRYVYMTPLYIVLEKPMFSCASFEVQQ